MPKTTGDRPRRPAPAAGGAVSDVDRLILEAATGARQLSDDELRRVLQHVAQAGFDPNAVEHVGGRLRGLTWNGQVLSGSDVLPPGDVHYLRHVVARREWPVGTTLDQYISSVRRIILAPGAGVFVNQYAQREWQVGVVAPSGQWKGPVGGDWILVEYRVSTGHWVTCYQLAPGPPAQRVAAEVQRRSVRWLRTI